MSIGNPFFKVIESMFKKTENKPDISEMSNPVEMRPEAGEFQGFVRIAIFENGLFVDGKFEHDDIVFALSRIMSTHDEWAQIFRQAYILKTTNENIDRIMKAVGESNAESNAEINFKKAEAHIRKVVGETEEANKMIESLKKIMFDEKGRCNCPSCKMRRKIQDEQAKAMKN